VQSVPLLRRAVFETDPNASAFHTVPLAEYTEVATFGQKVAANLMAALGLMCLLLAAVGLYSVMSYTVTQRIPEIGIRIAMGATPRNVIGMVVGQGIALAAAGVALGAVASLAAARFVSSMLCGVNPNDPWSFVLAGLFLGLIALLAAWLPAFRATRIDPISALRR
jgi:ABC-type antimicrobial peptide transport system permease subunit